MSTTLDPQTVESKGFTDYDNYTFEGDDGTVEKKRKVIEGYRIKASLYHAAQYAGCARASIYRWMERDTEFAQALADAHEDSADIMETSVYERAFNDNLLAMFWLKAHRHQYRDKVTVDIQAVNEEIQERMKQVGSASTTQTLQIPPPLGQLQKELAVPSSSSQLPVGADDDSSGDNNHNG